MKSIQEGREIVKYLSECAAELTVAEVFKPGCVVESPGESSLVSTPTFHAHNSYIRSSGIGTKA